MFDQFKVYIIGGAVLAASIFVGSLLWQISSLSGQLSASEASKLATEGERDKAIQANEANTAALQVLAMNQGVNNQLLTSLADEMTKLQSDMKAVKSDREKLARENPDVKAYLNTPVPAALRVRSATNQTGVQN